MEKPNIEICKVYDDESARRWKLNAELDLPKGTHFINPIEVSTETGLWLGFVTIMADSPAEGHKDAEFYLRFDCPERLDQELGETEFEFAYRIATLKGDKALDAAPGVTIQPGEGILQSIALIPTQQRRDAVGGK
jgi:hypothetical protein